MSAIPPAVRRAVAERSGGWCELHCGRRAEHQHHRRLRSQGGQHTLANLVALCGRCHTKIHANPAHSYEAGLLVHSWDDPADVPVGLGIQTIGMA